jgi:hypothetical protein
MLIPGIVVGITRGTHLIRRLDAETFRRICMSFDAWVVGFGLSRVLMDLNLMESPWAYSVTAGRHFDRQLFIVHLLHSSGVGTKAIGNIAGSTDNRRPEWRPRSYDYRNNEVRNSADLNTPGLLFGRYYRRSASPMMLSKGDFWGSVHQALTFQASFLPVILR